MWLIYIRYERRRKDELPQGVGASLTEVESTCSNVKTCNVVIVSNNKREYEKKTIKMVRNYLSFSF